jgi:hypothetical protein
VTRDGGFKRLVRARMGRTGESYTTARARLWRRRRPAELDELPDADLVARCSASIARRMHVAGPEAQRTVVLQLTQGQRMLLAFSIVHGHAGRGLPGLVAEMPHRLVHDGFWALLEAGLRLVGDDALLSLMRELRREVAGAIAGAGLPEDFGRDGALDAGAFARLLEALERLEPEVVRQLDERYLSLVPGSVRRVARHIRANAGEFVPIEA